MKRLTSTEFFMAFLVEVIRQFWDRGLYRNNKILSRCHDEWFWAWVEMKTQNTMRSVDRQIEELAQEPELVKPLYWEDKEGETPLGGTLGYTYHLDDGSSGTNPVQGAE